MFNNKGTLITVVIISALWYLFLDPKNVIDTEEEKQYVKDQVSAWKEKGKFFDYESHQIFYIDYKNDNKENLLVLHGFPTSSWDFDYIMPNLTNKFRVIIFDMIGYGFSAKPYHFNYTIVTQADIALKLLSLLDIKEFHILAHDYGVSVAQEIMARKQNDENNQIDIKSVAFLNGGLFPAAYRPLFTQKLALSPIGPYIHHVMSRNTIASTLKKIFGPYTPPTKKEIMTFYEFISINNGLPVFHKILNYINERAENERRWAKPIAKPNYPIRLVNGPFDPISGGHVVDYFNEMTLDRTRADAIKLNETIGHYPHIEATEAVAVELKKFWEKVDSYYQK